jgi:hypothetical protein
MDRCLAALSIMSTPNASRAYITRTMSQFMPRNFFRNCVMGVATKILQAGWLARRV